MPVYHVECADRDDGRPYTIACEARSPAEALAKASAQHIASRVLPTPHLPPTPGTENGHVPPPPPPPSLPMRLSDEDRQWLSERLNELRPYPPDLEARPVTLESRSWPFDRRMGPVHTIAWGVILGLFGFFACLIAIPMVLMLLGVSLTKLVEMLAPVR